MPDVIGLYREALRLFQHNQIEQAANLLEQALSLDSSYQDALEALGVIYGQLNRFDEAIQLMKRLAELSPDHVMTHANLSRFYQRKGMLDEAEREQAEARRLSWKEELRAKKMSDADIEKLSAEDAIQQAGVLDSNLEHYPKVIEYDPKDVLGYFSLGTVYLQAKRYLDALQALQKAIEVNQDHSPSYAALGETLEALGQKEEAIGIYQAGIPVAEHRGDIIPLRKMENRLQKLRAGPA